MMLERDGKDSSFLESNGNRTESNGCRRKGGQGRGMGYGRGLGNGLGRQGRPEGGCGQGMRQGPCGKKKMNTNNN